MDGDTLTLPPHRMMEQFADINVAAPMVRYSKLPFRHLVSLYQCHIIHTPMILATEFSRSANARMTDFSTSSQERGTFLLEDKKISNLCLLDEAPSELNLYNRRKRVRGSLVAQFAANDSRSFADALELIRPHVDGVDLNCGDFLLSLHDPANLCLEKLVPWETTGCPQKWAYEEQIGSWLLRHPEIISDIIRSAKNRVETSFPISIKIRIDEDPKVTEQLIQTAIHAGVSHITVHGRTRNQASSHPVSLPSIAFAVSAARQEVPIIANGDAWDITEVNAIRDKTHADAVMSARGLLANPALFSGFQITPKEAIQKFLHLSTDYGMLLPLFHRHLSYMLEAQLTRHERVYLNSLASYAGIIDFLETKYPDICLPI